MAEELVRPGAIPRVAGTDDPKTGRASDFRMTESRADTIGRVERWRGDGRPRLAFPTAPWLQGNSKPPGGETVMWSPCLRATTCHSRRFPAAGEALRSRSAGTRSSVSVPAGWVSRRFKPGSKKRISYRSASATPRHWKRIDSGSGLVTGSSSGPTDDCSRSPRIACSSGGRVVCFLECAHGNQQGTAAGADAGMRQARIRVVQVAQIAQLIRAVAGRVHSASHPHADRRGSDGPMQAVSSSPGTGPVSRRLRQSSS